jgi:hypothetical protein
MGKTEFKVKIGPHPHDLHNGGVYVAANGQTYLHTDGVWRRGTYLHEKGYTGYFPTRQEAEAMLEKVGLPKELFL